MEYGIVGAIIIGLLFLPRIRAYFLAQTGANDPKTAREMLVVTRVRQIKHFFVHAGIYAIVVIGSILISVMLNTGRDVFIVSVVWGIILALHAFYVFGINGALQDWEKRRVQSMLRREDDAS